MPHPAAIETVVIGHTYLRADGTPAEGEVKFTPCFTPIAIDLTDDTTYVPTTIAFELIAGVLSADLMSTNQANIGTPPDQWTYKVHELVDEYENIYYVFLDHEVTTAAVDLRDLVSVAINDGQP